jgi:hypothetical protein
MNLYSVQVVAELTPVIYRKNQQVESESSHLGLLTRVESLKIVTRVQVK